MLGIWIAADGNQHRKLEILQLGVDLWLDSISKCYLNDQDKQLAYASFLHLQLVYPLGCTSIGHKDMKQLFRPVLDQILHTLGLNKHFLLVMVHSGPDWPGLGIDDLPTMQGVALLQLLFRHLNKQDCTGVLIQIEWDYLELVIGLGKCPLLEPHIASLDYAPATWITSISDFLHQHQSKVEVKHKNVMPIQRNHNRHMKQLALDVNFKLELIHQCWLCLHVATLADVVNTEGSQLETWAYSRPGQASRLKWPSQGEPSKTPRAEWRLLLKLLLSTYGRMVGWYLIPIYRLGKWNSTPTMGLAAQWQDCGEVRWSEILAGYWQEGQI